VDEQEEQPSPPPDVFPILPLKADICLATSSDLHSGQVTSIFSLLDLNKISNK
jgi:hypothetical protein